MAVNQDLPLLGIVKTQQQTEEGRFASTTGANECNCFPGFDYKAQVV
jgi:hypothetical protein